MTELTDEAVKTLLDGATPGPRELDGVRPHTAHVWPVDGSDDPITGEIDIDNAHLIAAAAAPDLARALLDVRADAQAAVALAYEAAADSLLEASVWCDSQERTDASWHNGVVDARKHHMARIRALAPADGLAAVEALRGEARESAMQALASMGQAQEAYEAQLKAEAELAAAQQREAGLLEALTPSGDTKAAYMGEIKDPDTKRMVSWTAIKMVMAMVSARAALSHNGRGE